MNELEDCLDFSGDDLVVVPPRGKRHEIMEEIDAVCRWWREGLIWVVWPSVGNQRHVELRDEDGLIAFEAIIGPLYGGPYSPEQAVHFGRIVQAFREAEGKGNTAAKQMAA